jgi:hypothetical protein
MNAQRKLQLSAAAIIANSLLVLGMTAPAGAQSCQPFAFVCGICPSIDYCQANLPPGCSIATHVECTMPFFVCINYFIEARCYYQ